MSQSVPVPTGKDYLQMLNLAAKQAQVAVVSRQETHSSEFVVIGTSLSSLYQAATCHRGCHGGSHTLERLCGRAHNIGCGALSLIEVGLYDEALNFIRGLGEISNLVILSIVDKPGIQEWLQSDRKTRLRKFSPARIRERIKGHLPGLMIANAEWYGAFSENYVHPNRGTMPGSIGAGGMIGPFYQSEDVEKTTRELAMLTGILSMMVCKFFKFSDVETVLRGQLEALSSSLEARGV